MQHSRAQEPIEMSLREHLLAASGASSSGPAPYPPTSTAHSGHDNPYAQASDEHHHLDPNVAGQQMPYAMTGDGQADDGMNSERKGKRELSTSKRAAQNRAAQRAFRQRKEGYIKKLEEQCKEYQNMEHNYKALQSENFQLREYILSLQSRLLENQSDFPPAPSHINLSSGGPSQPTMAESAYGPEQQLRREMDRITHPAPVVAREDHIDRDHLDRVNELKTAVAPKQRDPQSSPYGLGGQYPAQQPEPRPTSKDAEKDSKAAS